MPPVQMTLRGSLLTGASALSLTVAASGARAVEPVVTWNWSVWAEAVQFNTTGGNLNAPYLNTALPALSAPFFSFGPTGGWEFAAGADLRWERTPWHIVFDVRGGRSRTSAPQGSVFAINSFFSFYSSSTTTGARTAWKTESHFVADFMVGRDYKLGTSSGEVQFGIRIADLRGTINETLNSVTTNFFKYSSSTTLGGAFATFRSHFVGAGPRLAFTGSLPILAAWTFDYGAGVAALIGNRTLDVTVTSNYAYGNFGLSYENSSVFVFNIDGWAALSYQLSKQFKASFGIRADSYSNPFLTYSVGGNGIGLETVSRTYWGPFIRVTGYF